ncbi:putative disease resistance protein RGA4 [Vitis riparia]|uniref:putative disease resistance protein RGA4 n=1 Tax=Vitis riparia TaxID=96939 RepID=UPI00155B3DA2|nr:putative disease resistance protein RGA4 [Vitis riparia]XP_034679166.1 putative disease resistance protein RGA4 [Vitis riparia]XP_034679167.1 putative disease resistance protein RGA4 [Vitis riparia]XP_034679168.1 putative disease resistance protein RGA4 [Vitis riparia]XP_034679169.1 putative disease resistance protein RGA4 [Vitis riparia]XP_034679170.1 putative disease resistance protein RGA4 [Vitis riparia]XP_034679171.1 putative disease resistance protein RGA4 [Vitis riparia]XP_03467917
MADQIPFGVVEHIVTKLGSKAFQEIGSMYGVPKEMTKLNGKLGTIKAVLLDAEEKQQQSNHAVKDWVRRFRGVVYDADDLLDDYATHYLQRGGLAKQVSDFFSSENQVAFRLNMSHRLKDIKERIDDIAKEIPMLNLTPRDIVLHTRVENSGRDTHSFVLKSEMVGREENKEEIIGKLLSSKGEEKLSVVAIVGIGGLGKTTLAQLVYNDERVVNHFEFKIWACLSDDSGDGFDVNMWIKKILKSLNDGGAESLETMKTKLHEKISQKRYLLVLDDVWNQNPQQWDHVRTLLMVGAIGSKIVVTTRKPRVASLMGDNFPINLKGLDENDSWRLFSKIAFKDGEEDVHTNITQTGKEIAKMCKGVPLIIKSLAMILGSKREPGQWLSIRNNKNLLSLGDENENVLGVLKLSYDNLPTHLRQCFTYCALFPKDYEIEKKLVVQLWIAQGYIQSSNDNNKQLEDIGDQYFEELLSRSLLEKVRTNRFTNTLICKMHDLIHDLAQSIVGSEILILRSDVNNISEEVHHVSLFEEVNPMIKARKPIRTFLNLGEHSFKDSTIVNSIFPSFMCLRALSLSHMGVEKVPKCLGKLSHLRYLDLSYNDFEVLPNAITKLKNLQTLKLASCQRLKRIPDNIGELINLRHLENSRCHDLTHMPHGIGKLTLLQSLPLFVVGNDVGLRNHKIGSLIELESLKQLRGGLCISNLQNVRDVELVSRGKFLKGKQYLQSLRLEWNRRGQDGGDEGHKSVMEGLQPHQHLKGIFIEGYGGTEFPTWMMNDGLGSLFPYLIEIEISGCSRCKILPPFSQLPSLKSLTLDDMKEAVELKEGSLTTPLFPSLESLELSYMPKLKELWRMDLLAEEGPSFSHLSKLYIYACSGLASLELHSPSLSQLDIRLCDNLASLELHSSPSLSGLTIHDCPNLTSMELPSSPSLSRLEIRKCPNLASFKVAPLPSLETLSLFTVRYGVIWQIMSVSASSSLKSLYIESIDDMISLPKELLQHVSGLVTLWIRRCHNLASLELPSSPSLSGLTIDDCPNLTSMELPSSLCLSDLEISKCPNLASFKVAPLPSLETLSLFTVRYGVIWQIMSVSASSSLRCLYIKSIDDMISLPKELLQHISGLVTLEIRECPNLQSMELPSSHCLSKLKIVECPNLASFNVASLPRLEELSLRGVRAEVLRQLMFVSASSSLKSLGIWEIDGMISLPEEPLQYVSTLETLYIVECSGLATLLHWMGSLSSLTELIIDDCSELTSLPEEIYSLKKLQTFYFCDYPHLEERYNKETGKDRAKIAHIPHVRFNSDYIMRVKTLFAR